MIGARTCWFETTKVGDHPQAIPGLCRVRPCAAPHYSPAATRLVGSMGQRLQQVSVTLAKDAHLQVADPV